MSFATLVAEPADQSHDWPPDTTGAFEIATVGNIFVVVTDRAEHLEEYLPEWEDLAADAAEPNVFYEPWMLLPAVRSFARDQKLLFVLLFAPAGELFSGAPRLVGFFPLAYERGYHNLPLRVCRPWKHLHCFLCTPLLRAGYESICWQGLLRWLRQSGPGVSLLELDWLASDGPVSRALELTLQRRNQPALETEAFERALLVPSDDAEAYIADALSTGNRKELRRQRRRLGEQGELRTVTLEPGDDLEPWLDEFCRLEALGWKGENGTALALRHEDERFFRTIAKAAFERGRLMMLGLRLGERLIAMKCNFLAGEGSFAFKIAYDESFAKFSPGVQLELDNIHEVHARPDLRWMDSCAAAAHPMIDRLWKERRKMQTLLVSTGRFPGDALVRLLPALRWLRRKLRR